MEDLIRKFHLRKKIVMTAMVTFFVIVASAFFISSVTDTLSIGRTVLGEERYSARMNDSYLFAGMILLLTLPMLLPINQFFEKYLKTIRTLSKTEVERLEKQNETAFFINKYLPSYIVKDKSFIFFKFFGTTEIPFMEVTKIKISPVSYKGGYSISFKTNASLFYYTFSETPENLSLIADYALEVNPNINVSAILRR
ncbi:hypothetical protein [Pedobacter caeni]|uniref:Uncharacterized protein n=1 Tax=Pedobacter caeni TaxID=288992 RepID=A0A1M4WD65_9SPHI|nr:hypothetical protein [Pedobacter caeni]SHE79127.1 hypothetical protein SAMN04488522_1011225 [Pedobacter caeni]